MQPAQEGMGEGEGMLQGKHSSGISAGPILSPHPCSGWSCCLHPHSGDILLFPELFAALVYLSVLPGCWNEPESSYPSLGGVIVPKSWVWSGKEDGSYSAQLSWDSINLHLKYPSIPLRSNSFL